MSKIVNVCMVILQVLLFCGIVFSCITFPSVILLKRGCIEFKYYADAIHSGLTPPG